MDSIINGCPIMEYSWGSFVFLRASSCLGSFQQCSCQRRQRHRCSSGPTRSILLCTVGWVPKHWLNHLHLHHPQGLRRECRDTWGFRFSHSLSSTCPAAYRSLGWTSLPCRRWFCWQQFFPRGRPRKIRQSQVVPCLQFWSHICSFLMDAWRSCTSSCRSPFEFPSCCTAWSISGSLRRCWRSQLSRSRSCCGTGMCQVVARSDWGDRCKMSSNPEARVCPGCLQYHHQHRLLRRGEWGSDRESST